MIPKLYLTITREAILSVFENSQIDTNALLHAYPDLAQPCATFVTLTLNGKLRGCIGSLIAHRPLVEDLISNASSAAFRDPSFSPLSPKKFAMFRIEVSLLTPPQPIEYSSKDELKELIRPEIDGVILRYGNHQATFLPQVWEELRDFDSFFDHLGMKAGLGTDPLAHHPDIYTYQVQKYEEEPHE
jgi:uncharacterized protein